MIRSAILGAMLFGAVAFGQNAADAKATPTPAMADRDRMLSALVALERTIDEGGNNAGAPPARDATANATGPISKAADSERTKAVRILKKFRTDLEALRVQTTDKKEPTDEQVRDYYRARAKLVDETMKQLEGELAPGLWRDVADHIGKHHSGLVRAVAKP